MHLARFRRRLAVVAAAIAALGASAGLAHADPVTLAGTGFPAPGGTTTSAVGSTGTGGGRTITYSGFDDSAYGDLYYVVGDYDPTWNPAGPHLWADSGGTGTSQMSFNSGASNLAGGVAVWTTDVPIDFYSPPYFYDGLTFPGRFTLTVTDTLGNALSLTDASTILGMPSSVGGALQVAGDFKANWYFELYNGVSWVGAIDQFDGLWGVTGDVLHRSVGGAFYYTPSGADPVPEPATLALMGLGAAGLGWKRRRSAARTRA